jgi:methylmalonyl-CoA mutase cobalamin-binding domain/chain
MPQQDLMQKLAHAVVSCQALEVEMAAREALAAGLHPYDVIKGLSAGMREMGRLWTEMEVFLPEVTASADAYYVGLQLAKAALPGGTGAASAGTLVLGVVHGDIHSVGKDVVIPVFQAENFNVIDLGVNVSASRFAEATREHKADVVGLGTYLGETFLYVSEVVKALVEAGIRKDLIVVCGGPDADAVIARRMGADNAFTDAWAAVEWVRQALRDKKKV